MGKRVVVAFITSLLLVGGVPVGGFCETLAVGKGGGFTTIQEAVNAARPGDDIVVASGRYETDESIYIARKKNLVIRGEGTVEIACRDYVPVFYIYHSQKIMISRIHGVHHVDDPAVGRAGCGPGATIITAEKCVGIVIQDCELNGCGQTGFEGLDSNMIVLNRNYMHDNVHSAAEFSFSGTKPDVMIANNRIEENFGPVLISRQAGVWSSYDRNTQEQSGVVITGNTWRNNDRMPRRQVSVGGRGFVFWGPPDGYTDGKGRETIYGGVLDAATVIQAGHMTLILRARSYVEFNREGGITSGFAAEDQSVTRADGEVVVIPAGARLEFLPSGELSHAETPDGTVYEIQD